MYNPFLKTTIRGIGMFVYKNPEARVQFPRPVAFDATININVACPDIGVFNDGTVFVKREDCSLSNV